MGCFNHTCGVSSLPVEDNDPVMVLVLAANRFLYPGRQNNSLIYANHFYEPFGFPFRARYNDYGWVDKHENSSFLDWTLKKIDESLIERPVGSNQYHDPAVERGRMTVDYLGELLWEDRLRLGNPTVRSVYVGEGEEPLSAYRSTGYMFVHEHVYDRLVKDYSEKVYDFAAKDYIDQTVSSYRLSIQEAIDAFKPDDGDKLNMLTNHRLEYDFGQRYPAAKQLINVTKDISNLDQEQLLQRLSEIAVFDRCMCRLHKLYMPQRSGSQDGVPKKLFQSLTRAMKTVIKDKSKRYKE